MNRSSSARILPIRVFLFSLLLLSAFSVVACGETGTTASSTVSETTDTTLPPVSLLSGESLEDSSLVRWIGRTLYDEVAEKMNFYYTGTGFTVSFHGTEVRAVLSGTHTASSTERPYFTVSVDGEVAPEGRTVVLETPEADTVLVSGLEDGDHVLTFLKRSEALDSETAVSRIATDGWFLSPAPASETKVLILGASGITGYGVLGSQGQARTTANSDSLSGFGYLVARGLGADFQFVSASGWGLVWGYNNTSGTVNIQAAFDRVGIDDDGHLLEETCDPSLFVPDYIVVNIGGNDFDAYVSRLSGAALTAAKRTFREAVAAFCTKLHELYPDARIFWTHTGSQNGTEAATALSDLDPKETFAEIVVILKVGEDGDPEGAAGHAGVLTQAKNAQIVLSAIAAHGG